MFVGIELISIKSLPECIIFLIDTWSRKKKKCDKRGRGNWRWMQGNHSFLNTSVHASVMHLKIATISSTHSKPYARFFINIISLCNNVILNEVRVVKNPPANAGDGTDAGSISCIGKMPGVGNSNSFQYSCLENPMDKRAWQATFSGVAESDTTEGT